MDESAFETLPPQIPHLVINNQAAEDRVAPRRRRYVAAVLAVLCLCLCLALGTARLLCGFRTVYVGVIGAGITRPLVPWGWPFFREHGVDAVDDLAQEDDSEVFVLYVIRHAERYSNLADTVGEKRHACDPPMDPPLPGKYLNCSDGFDGNTCGGGLGGFLTEEGLARARCLAARAANGTLFTPPGPPRRLWSQWPGLCDDKNVKREYQTIWPLSLRFAVPIETHYSSLAVRNETSFEHERISRIALGARATQLFAEDILDVGVGPRTLCGGWGAVSWDHGELTHLFTALGCTSRLCTTRWYKGEFDQMVRLTFSCGNKTRPTARHFRRAELVPQHCGYPELLLPEDCVGGQCPALYACTEAITLLFVGVAAIWVCATRMLKRCSHGSLQGGAE